jgi:hypothetical protein
MPYSKSALKQKKKDELVDIAIRLYKQVEYQVLFSSDEETSTEAVFPKEQQLQQLEKANQGPFHVNIDVLWELREEKKRWEEEQKTPTEQDIMANLKEENERLKQHIIHNYQDLHPNGDGIPHTEYFPGGRYAIDEQEEKRIADAFAKKYPDKKRPQPRTPYSTLCGQIGEGIEDLQSKVDNLERYLCGAVSLCCDCCQSSITEDDVNMSIEKRCGKLLCEECCDEQEDEDEAQKWKKMYEEAIAERNTESQKRLAESEKKARELTKWGDLAASMKKEIQELKDRNDELEDNYCDEMDKVKEENDSLKEEMERIQEKLDEMYEFSYFTKLKKAEVEIKKLEKYETMIYRVWSDLYWADKAGCDVSFKDVANSCDYYENEDFVKAEVVEDEEIEERKE